MSSISGSDWIIIVSIMTVGWLINTYFQYRNWR